MGHTYNAHIDFRPEDPFDEIYIHPNPLFVVSRFYYLDFFSSSNLLSFYCAQRRFLYQTICIDGFGSPRILLRLDSAVCDCL